jgi:hypothetical protein
MTKPTPVRQLSDDDLMAEWRGVLQKARADPAEVEEATARDLELSREIIRRERDEGKRFHRLGQHLP